MVRHLLLTGCLFLSAISSHVQGRISVQLVDTTVARPRGLTSTKEPTLSSYTVAIRGGLTQFFGELGDQDMKTVVGVSVMRQVGSALSLGLDFTSGKLGGERKDFFNSYFVNEYNTIELLARWDLTEQFSRHAASNRLHLGVYGGLGLMIFSASAYDITTDKLVRFSNSAVSGRNPLFFRYGPPSGPPGITKTHERVIPLGLMFNYRLTDQWRLGVDYRFYMVRSDKVDATSGHRLMNPEEADSYSDTPNDKFGFLSVGLSYRLRHIPRDRDRDNDGVPDARDRCPNTPGSPKFSGCPDRDNDGVPDYQDRCPNAPGTVKTHGCPDTDGDGILDRNDECPTVAGTVKGCPDRDKDGVRDAYDGCPDTPGLRRFGGCPDTDGDGVPDQVDFCPEIPGTYKNGGCPDSDGDGVHDGIDQCPNQRGPKYNKGCPVVGVEKKW